LAVDPEPRTSKPAKTSAAAPWEAAQSFKFLDVKEFLLLVSNVADTPLRRSTAA
jgi:hypothetical protein